MKKKITVVYSSHFSNEENLKFSDHVAETIGVKHDIHCYPNHNEYSLPEVYNLALKQYHDDIEDNGESIFVFIHHDIVFKTKDWGKKLLQIFNKTKYSIVGLAGSITLYKHGCWWLNERGDKMSNNMIGRVWHTNGIREWCSDYNSKSYLKDVCVIDGVFMAVDPDDIEHRFDEDFKGFHLYDISFTFSNVLDGVDVAVTNAINILHKSIGQTNQQWEDNKKQFAEKYKEELPFSINDYINI